MLRRLYDWSMNLASGKHAERGMGIISFMESSFFPIPPDVFLIPMVLARRDKWIRIATICTVASVLGALLGYVIGAFFYEAVAQPILATLGKEDSIAKIKVWFDEWGVWAVLFAALTPFPFKVLTIFSGFISLNLLAFIIVCLIGRSARFFLVCGLLWKFGEPIRHFIEKRLGLVFTLFMICLIGGFAAISFFL